MQAMGRRLLAACLFALAAGGCYETPKPACQFLCGDGEACPDGYGCGDDSRCHRIEGNGDLAACPDDLPTIPDARAPDAEPGPGDAEVVDAEPVDAEPPDATPTCAAFSTTSVGNIIITEVNPGDYLELYNNSAGSIDLSATTLVLHSPPTGSLALTGTIPSGGFRTFAWPVAFTDTDAGGEILLYTDDDDFTDGTKILDFVPWGAEPGTSRQALAEANGKWADTGNRPGAITGGAIHLLTATDGLDVADFSVSAAPSPANCDP